MFFDGIGDSLYKFFLCDHTYDFSQFSQKVVAVTENKLETY